MPDDNDDPVSTTTGHEARDEFERLTNTIAVSVHVASEFADDGDIADEMLSRAAALSDCNDLAYGGLCNVGYDRWEAARPPDSNSISTGFAATSRQTAHSAR